MLNFGEMSRRIWARLKGLFIHGHIFEEQDKRESAVTQSDADKPEGVRAWGEDPAAGLPVPSDGTTEPLPAALIPDTANFMPRCFIN